MSQWSKWSRTAFSTMRKASSVDSLSLVWPWNSGSRMKTESSAPDVLITSSAVMTAARLLLVSSRIAAQRPGERRAEALLVRAALGRRDGVAVGGREAVVAAEPGHRPFDRAVPAFLLDAAGEDLVDHARLALQTLGQEVLQPAGEMEHRLGGRVLVLDEGGIAGPADLDAAEEIGLGARHAESRAARKLACPCRRSASSGWKRDLGAAAVRDLAEIGSLLDRLAALELLAVELRPRATSTSTWSESAFTTDTPTPCRPPEVS